MFDNHKIERWEIGVGVVANSKSDGYLLIWNDTAFGSSLNTAGPLHACACSVASLRMHSMHTSQVAIESRFLSAPICVSPPFVLSPFNYPGLLLMAQLCSTQNERNSSPLAIILCYSQHSLYCPLEAKNKRKQCLQDAIKSRSSAPSQWS